MIKRLAMIALVGAIMVAAVYAQTVQTKVTIAVTNTYQQLLGPNQSRKDCVGQYVAVAGAKGYVFFGSAAPADTTTSFQLTGGQPFNCSSALFAQRKGVWVTATGTDIFIVLEDAGEEP